MKFKQYFSLLCLVILALSFNSCQTIKQTKWKTDATQLEKDLEKTKKNAFIVFTLSDTDERSQHLLKNVFTKDFFVNASKNFILYNVDIVRDESLMPAKDLERNYRLLSEYGALEVPFLCLTNADGDVYYSHLLPEKIKTTQEFLNYLNELYEKKGKLVDELKLKIATAEGVNKIKAIDAFFNKIYSVDREKYVPLFKAGIESDPTNKSGLTGKFILADKQITVDKLLADKKYAAAIKEFKEVIESKMLKPEEEQAVWCNIAYFSSALPNATKEETLKYLEKALKAAPRSKRAKDIRDDITFIKNKK